MNDFPNVSKLYLFAKDTDAPEVSKGFKFQELITLEVWLYNKVHGIEENIYCDFEEDIYQRDLKEYKSIFRQLKLYSSKNFSFSSVEIKKSLAHFFMLFVKGEYLNDETLFIFETNTSIAAKNGDNDAELLKEWAENQENISDDLKVRCYARIKAIIDDYIFDQYELLVKKGENESLIIAKEVYENLPENVWKEFVKSIRWQFHSVSSGEAIESSVHNSMELISQLPFPLSKDDYTKIFDRLRGVVSDKSIADTPDGRLLTNELLDQQLLNLGDKDDKVYSQSFDIWKNVKEVEYFNVGEFYQVMFAAKHCRWNKYLHGHSSIWLNLLQNYITVPGIWEKLKREAIYEIVWLTSRPSFHKELNISSLKGLEVLAIEYFSNFNKYNDLFCIEDGLNLLVLIASHQKHNLIEIPDDQIISWFVNFDKLIETCKANPADKNAYCHLLELEGLAYFDKNSLRIGEDNLKKSEIILNDIITELPNAPLYPVSQLSKRINAIINMIYRSGTNGLEDQIKLLEIFSEKLLPFVKDREGSFSVAKTYTERGIACLNNKNPGGILKALDYYHKAKELYYNEATYEGFLLAVMGISQLYASIGMNLAAKYYSLVAIWFCITRDDPKLYKRISQSYALLFHQDFKQGSWMSALHDFRYYINTRNEFETKEFDLSTDELFRKSYTEGTILFALMPIISNQLKGLIDYEKLKMGSLYVDLFEEGVIYVESEYTKIGLAEILEKHLENPPISDLGEKRIIAWKAFGSSWNVEFPNEYLYNSLGEEFAALIQIFQTDIALSGIDFHLLKGTVKIFIEINEDKKSPEMIPSDYEYLWKVFIPVILSKEIGDKSMHYGMITTYLNIILDEMSVLSSKQFEKLFFELFGNGIGNKALVVNVYQKAYRDIYSEGEFNISMRNKFNAEFSQIERYESSTLASNENRSLLYDQEGSLRAIRKRYNVGLKTIHLSLNRLKKFDEFNIEIEKLSKDGWLDWQIALALFNNIINLKANNFLGQNGKFYKSEDEYINDLKSTIENIIEKDESDNYIEIPLKEIIGDNLYFQLKRIPITVLNSYGLENKSRYPNIKAVRELLNRKFRFNIDEIEVLSPFKNISLNDNSN